MIEELREIGEDCDNEKEAVDIKRAVAEREVALENTRAIVREACLLYTSPSPRDRSLSRMPSSA